MKKYITIADPIYYIKSANGEILDIFKTKNNVISGTIKMAIEYPGNSFFSVKKIQDSEEIIFSLNFDAKFSFEDIKLVYQSIIISYQNKLSKTRFWRKS